MASLPTNPARASSGSDSKTARKKKAKAEAVASTSQSANGPHDATVESAKEEGSTDGHGDHDAGSEHPHLRELQKQIRNINKKLSATQKTDAVLAENPGVSLDDLVAQRKINNDQKASILKKPQLQAQLSQIDEQIQQFRQVESEFRQQLQKQKQELTAQHEQELAKVRAESAPAAAPSNDSSHLCEKLLVFSQFLRTAASKRSVEEDAMSPENMAFEGALLLVYGGDDKAVEAAINIIEGSDVPVPGIDGELLPVKYSVVRESSISHQPFANEEPNIASGDSGATIGSDPTITHAGLTELNGSTPTNSIAIQGAHDGTGGAGDGSSNLAGERWDPAASGTTSGTLEEGYEIIPRPSDEVDNPVPAAGGAQGLSTSWADDTAAHDAPSSGNVAGDNWDVRAPGEQSSWAEETVPAAFGDDGFQQIPNRQRGRGGRGRGDGEGRGRGGRGGRGGAYRGDGVEGGRGRGRGGHRGARGDGEDRGRGGRGRGRARGEGGPPRAQ